MGRITARGFSRITPANLAVKWDTAPCVDDNAAYSFFDGLMFASYITYSCAQTLRPE